MCTTPPGSMWDELNCTSIGAQRTAAVPSLISWSLGLTVCIVGLPEQSSVSTTSFTASILLPSPPY